MKILHFDSVGGASGDMILAALCALGVSAEKLHKQLATLPIGDFDIEATEARSHGLHGLRVSVDVSSGDQPDRSFRDIRQLIEKSALPESVRQNAIKAFTLLAEAEARVHGTSPDDIHFHEVGAADSIVDIIGCCLAMHLLEVEGVSVGPLPLGSGTVECRHGTYPVPAPATQELLKGHPTTRTTERAELVTPTGAALLMSWKSSGAAVNDAVAVEIGYGFGRQMLEKRPNVLRAVLFEATQSGDDQCMVLECNIDDTIPEIIGTLVGRLLEAGALDVFTTAVQMKKQRQGILLTVLCASERREDMLDLIFKESTTFGVREHAVQRTRLDRRFEEVETSYGPLRVKIGTWRGVDVTCAPELDDCVQLSSEHGVPVRAVYEAALKAAQKRGQTANE